MSSPTPAALTESKVRSSVSPSAHQLEAAWKLLQPEGSLWIESLSAQQVLAALPDAKVRQGKSGWLTAIKPRSEQLDVWSHPRHDASRNAVSKDQLAGAPRGVRWSGGPLWPRGYRKSAVPAINVGPRQMVYVLQDEVAEHGRMVSRDSLVARDAFNGLPLWKRPATSHLIVTHGDRIFAAADRKVVELSTRNGQQLRVFDTEPPKDIAISSGLLLVKSAESISAWPLEPLASIERPVWRHAVKADRMLADSSQVYFNVDESRRGGAAKLAALDLATGKVAWEQPTEPYEKGGPDLVSTGAGVIILAGREGNHAVSTSDGAHRWHYPYDRIGHGGSYEKVLIIEQLVWVHVAESKDSAGPAWVGLDPTTGNAVRQLAQPKDFKSKHRCSFDVATGRWVLCGSMDFANVDTGDYTHFAAARNSCAAAGVVPANGLVYSFPHACGCYPMLRGLLALESDDAETLDPVRAGELIRGPAFVPSASNVVPPKSRDWTTYRGNSARRGTTPHALKQSASTAQLQVAWKTQVAAGDAEDPLWWEWQLRDSVIVSPPVHSKGVVYIADAEAHRLLAIATDGKSAKVKWEFFAGARIEGPPSIVGHHCLFGARDGAAYCVDCRDGQLIWKRSLVDGQNLTVAHGQLESAEPVRGASLVLGDKVLLVTGRHQSVGAGLWVHALDIATGEVHWQRRAENHPGVPDLLAGDQGVVQMGQWQSSLDAAVADSPSGLRKFIRGGRLGLQDNTWYRRPIAMRRNLQQWTAPEETAGQLVCFDDQRTYAYRASEKVLGANGVLFGRGRIEGRFRDSKRKPWKVVFGNASRVSGMVLAGDSLFVAGDFYESLLASKRTELRQYDAATGKLLHSMSLPARPVHDGLISDAGVLLASLVDGQLVAVGWRESKRDKQER